MSSVLIRFFGPIKEGYKKNEGFLDIAPVTIFCGNQATGKSTIAKVYATFSWLEKALVRGDYEGNQVITQDFLHLLENQRIHEYLTPMTCLKFKGKAYDFLYSMRRENSHLSNR